MKKYHLDYREDWDVVKSVVDEVVIKVTYGERSEPTFKVELERWHPNLIAYIAQTTIKVWEARKKPEEKFES